MAIVQARCPRCRNYRPLVKVAVYEPPGTIKTVAVCAKCKPLVEKLGWFEFNERRKYK